MCENIKKRMRDNMINRVIWIVLDSVGMGELPDADRFGDVGSNTIGNVSAKVGGLKVPNMVKLGLGNIEGMKNIDRCESPKGVYARLAEISNGKDTTIGHWEMIGIYSPKAFPTYPNGFPKEVIDEFVKRTGVPGVLGNCTASGTEIIARLGDEHVKTKCPIVYTSADSVFQIACHEAVYSPEELWKMCKTAREMLTGEHALARVIARPFVGESGNYTRTANRRDFSWLPDNDNLLVRMKEAGLDVIGVGKIEDIFAGVGITEAVHTKDNMDGMDKTLEYMDRHNRGLIFTNLVEFDSKWGHRNDYKGYAQGLEEFDVRLKEVLDKMRDDDLLVITADHGCDPTMTQSTDHSREYVPMLMYGRQLKEGTDLKTGKTYANIGQTVADIFDLKPLAIGESYLKEILK